MVAKRWGKECPRVPFVRGVAGLCTTKLYYYAFSKLQTYTKVEKTAHFRRRIDEEHKHIKKSNTLKKSKKKA